MRIVAAVTRDGDRMCVLRLRGVVAGAEAGTDGLVPGRVEASGAVGTPSQAAASDDAGGLGSDDDADEVLTGPDLVPGLVDALLATFH